MTPRTARITGWAFAGLTAALLVPQIWIAATNPPPAVPSGLEIVESPWFVGLVVVLTLAFSLVGALILSRRPDNRLGWLFAADGLLLAANSLSLAYGYRALAADPGSLPGGRVAAWIPDITDPLQVGLATVFLFLLFPEGRLRGRAERRTAVVAAVGIGVALAAGIVEPSLQEYENVPTPLAPGTPSAVSETLLGLGFLVFAGTIVASIVLLVRRLRRAVGLERDQLRLLAWATAVAAALIMPAIFTPTSAPWSSAVYLLGGLGFLLIPVSVGVAILRHRLLDIDLVIRRTVIVALLGAFITAVYVGVVVGVGALVGGSGNAVLSAIAAAIVALAFQPVRRWAQRLANRFVFGKRATPYEVLHEFSERVAGSYGTEDVLPRMAAILGEGTGAERAQVWLRIGAELRPAAAWPDGARRSRPVPLSSAELPAMADVSHALPVRDGRELLGALSVTKGPSDPVTPTEEKLVADLALQAGLVLRNVRLVEDLRASRGRLVVAQDEERRRIERNIHDGAQQQLVALAVKAKLADAMVDRDVAKAHEMLTQIQMDTRDALETLRDLARGIYPPLLADEGLAAALEAQARKSPLPVDVRADGLERYSQQVEATAYFCCLEALQNAAKYSRASRVDMLLSASDGLLTFQVADDGAGFDQESTSRGSGLQNMIDRLEAIGGALEIRAAPGAGTTLVGRIPLGGDRVSGLGSPR